MRDRYFLTHGPYSIYELKFKGGGTHTVLAVRKSSGDVMEWMERRGSLVTEINELGLNAEILMGETMDYPMCAKFHDAIAEAIRNPDICDDLAIAEAKAEKNLELARKFARAFLELWRVSPRTAQEWKQYGSLSSDAENLAVAFDYSKSPF